MKRLSFLLFLLLSLQFSYAQVSITFDVKSDTTLELSFHLVEFGISNKVASTGGTGGEHELLLNIPNPLSFLRIGIDKEFFDILVEDKNNYTIQVNSLDGEMKISFSGYDAEVNTYLKNGIDFINNYRFKGKSYFQLEPEELEPAFEVFETDFKNYLDQQMEPETKNIEYIKKYLEAEFWTKYYHAAQANIVPNTVYAEKVLTKANELVLKDELLQLQSYSYQELLVSWLISKVTLGSAFAPGSEEFNEEVEDFIQETINSNTIESETKEFLIAKILNLNEEFWSTPKRLEIFNWYNETFPDSKYWKYLNKMNEKLINLETDAPAKNFIAFTTDEEEVSLNYLRGKWLYVDVWATWCGPCVKEFESSVELIDELKDKENLEFIFLSIDSQTEQWKKFVANKPELEGLHLNIRGEEESQFSKDYITGGIPQYFLVDPEGILVEISAPRPSDPKTLEMLRSL